LIDTQEKLEKVIKILSSAKEIVIDTETTGLNVIDAKLVGVGFMRKTQRGLLRACGFIFGFR